MSAQYARKTRSVTRCEPFIAADLSQSTPPPPPPLHLPGRIYLFVGPTPNSSVGDKLVSVGPQISVALDQWPTVPVV